MSIQNIHRTIFFYDLFATFDPAFVLDKNKYSTNIQALLSLIRNLVKNKDSRRYQVLGDKMLFINEITIKPVPNRMIIQGKLLSVRKDFFPELLNTTTDITRDIDAKDEEGVVETTHFLIQQKTDNLGNKIKLAIEHNQFGAKINEFEFYLMKVGTALGIIRQITHTPIVRDSLSKTKSRIGEISKIIIKVSRDNIPAIKAVDQDVWSAINTVQQHFDEEYIQLELKYDIRKAREFPGSNSAIKSKNVVKKLIDGLVNNKNKIDNFERLEIIAEDSDRNDRLNAFDLLIDKARDTVPVERKLKSRTIVSVDMFEKMIQSWSRNRIS